MSWHDTAVYLLHVASEIEHALMVQYLYAGYSLNEDQPDERQGFTGLKSPKWPEEVLGRIDEALKAKGAALYDVHCKGCHLPPVQTSEFWNSKAWLPPTKYNQRHLHVEPIDIKKIGTDPAQAEDMKNRTVAIPANLGISTNKFGPALGELVA